MPHLARVFIGGRDPEATGFMNLVAPLGRAETVRGRRLPVGSMCIIMIPLIIMPPASGCVLCAEPGQAWFPAICDWGVKCV